MRAVIQMPIHIIEIGALGVQKKNVSKDPVGVASLHPPPYPLPLPNPASKMPA